MVDVITSRPARLVLALEEVSLHRRREIKALEDLEREEIKRQQKR